MRSGIDIDGYLVDYADDLQLYVTPYAQSWTLRSLGSGPWVYRYTLAVL